jgi:hypothetical protein
VFFDVTNPTKVGGDEPRTEQEPSGTWEVGGEEPQLSARTDSGGARDRARFAGSGGAQPREGCRTPGGWPSASARSHGLYGGTTGARSGRRRTLKGNKAHGRIGRSTAGNRGGSLRTRRRSKALKSATPRWSARARRTGNGRRLGGRSRDQPRGHASGSRGARSGQPAPGSELGLGPGLASARGGHGSPDPRPGEGARSRSGHLLRQVRADRRRGVSPGAGELAPTEPTNAAHRARARAPRQRGMRGQRGTVPSAGCSGGTRTGRTEQAADRGSGPGRRAGLEVAREASGNDRRATAAVTRYGCRRGEFFEGYESRRGEGAGRAGSL